MRHLSIFTKCKSQKIVQLTKVKILRKERKKELGVVVLELTLHRISDVEFRVIYTLVDNLEMIASRQKQDSTPT